MRHVHVLVLMLVGVVSMFTNAGQAAIKTERVQYTVGGKVLEGFLAYDDARTDKRPGVLVCHEWWGMNDYAEYRATELAKLGYTAFALDMYGAKQTTNDPKVAGQLAGDLFKDPAVVVARAAAGLKVLAEHSTVDNKRLAATGYCMGGSVALALARSTEPYAKDLKAVACFHTSNLTATDAASNANIKGSVLVCHGQDDDFVKPEQIAGFHEQMKQAKIDYQFISYSGAVHAFTNPKADTYKVPGVRYHQTADKRSWGLFTQLLAEVFAAPASSPAPAKKP